MTDDVDLTTIVAALDMLEDDADYQERVVSEARAAVERIRQRIDEQRALVMDQANEIRALVAANHNAVSEVADLQARLDAAAEAGRTWCAFCHQSWGAHVEPCIFPQSGARPLQPHRYYGGA